MAELLSNDLIVNSLNEKKGLYFATKVIYSKSFLLLNPGMPAILKLICQNLEIGFEDTDYTFQTWYFYFGCLINLKDNTNSCLPRI